MSSEKGSYYLPGPSRWPIIASAGAATMLVGIANWLHGNWWGPYTFFGGLAILAFMMFGWFGTVIRENERGILTGKQLDRSFRWGMGWFIFSEVMLFGAFFGALFYLRVISVPWLSGHWLDGSMTHLLLWPNFHGGWPLYNTPNPSKFVGPSSVMAPWGIPAMNTLCLLTSGVTITFAHWSLLKERRGWLIVGMILTIMLGLAFLGLQAHEYWEAYTEKGLTLGSGAYGTTFFLLTGLHGLHVTIGTIGLITILGRCIKGHFTPENHFAFEAIAWYWHFVDVVWLLLFIFVYWFV